MARIKRNRPCPCGSGKKYKKCHGAIAAGESPLPEAFYEELEQHLKEIKALDARREQQQGLGRPIIAVKHNDHQLVAVANRLYYSKAWKTFHDFLRDHFFGLLGREWLDAERAKLPEDRHRIVRWFDEASDAFVRLGTKTGVVYSAPMTGATRAFVNLAYNIYLIAHHAGKGGDAVVKSYIDRLRSARADTFIDGSSDYRCLRQIAREAKEGSVRFEPEMKKMEPSPHRRPPPRLWTDQFLRNMDGNVVCCDVPHFAA
jgi:hypothetical protein